MRRTWSVRAGAAYLLLFLSAALVAPHRHQNPLADLITDGQSDSGSFWLARDPLGFLPGVAFSSARLVEDGPCLACFWHDVTTTGSRFFVMLFETLILLLATRLLPQRHSQILPATAISRGPPSAPSFS